MPGDATVGPNQLHRDALVESADAIDVGTLTYEALRDLFQGEIRDHLPKGHHAVDPRDGHPVLFNPARATRPHDNRPGQGADCIVCSGRVTRAVDVAGLSQGFTFINKNLYPAVHPTGQSGGQSGGKPAGPLAGAPDDQCVFGLHFLQWTSSVHDRDFHNMPARDREVVLDRLALLERVLLTTAVGHMPENSAWGDASPTAGFVVVIKNRGHLVGGSVAHGHQQIAFTNVMPGRFAENLRFERTHGKKYAAHILERTPADLVVADHGEATLLVPYFMRRPYDMQLVVRDTSRRYLHQLSAKERSALARGLRDGIRAMATVLEEAGRDLAYNIVTHSGPGAGLYLEFLPYTQEQGGLERLGLHVCQATPGQAAARLRAALQAWPGRSFRKD